MNLYFRISAAAQRVTVDAAHPPDSVSLMKTENENHHQQTKSTKPKNETIFKTMLIIYNIHILQ